MKKASLRHYTTESSHCSTKEMVVKIIMIPCFYSRDSDC